MLVRGDGTGRLGVPSFEAATGPDDGLEPVLTQVATILGGVAPILRVATLAVDAERRRTLVLVEADVPPEQDTPPGCDWLSLADVAPASLVPPSAVGVMDRWLAEQRSGSPAARRPGWARPGFLARASAWMEDRLAADGSPVLAPPRLHSVWCLSAVIRAETARGVAFLKACAPVFRDEPAITAAVGEVAGLTPPSSLATTGRAGCSCGTWVDGHGRPASGALG